MAPAPRSWFPDAKGEMVERIRRHDWAATPLGPIETWPRSLHTAVNLMLAARQPIYIACGPELPALYNDGYIPILGTKHPGALGQPYAMLWSEVWDEYQPVLQATMAGEAQYFIDRPIPLVGRIGQPVSWFTFSMTPLHDDAGAIFGIFVVATETTDKIRAEEALRQGQEALLLESRRRHSTLFEALDAGFCVIQRISEARSEPADCRFLEVNSAFERLTGFRDAVGKTLRDLVHDHAGDWLAVYSHVALTGEPMRFEEFASYLGDRWFEVHAFRIGQPEGQEVAVLLNDITARKHAEAALRDREEWLRLIVENVRDYAIFTIDRDCRIDTWLPGAARVFGWHAEDIVGRSAALIYTPEDREAGVPEKEIETAIRDGVARDVGWHLCKDGSRVFIEGNLTALRDPDRTIRGFLKVGQDVTERHAAEKRQALLMRELDHRAKNALAVVQAALRLTPKEDARTYAAAVEGRVAALALAQTLLAKEQWKGAGLTALLQSELAPFLGGQRADLEGPPVVLPPSTAQPLAMAVHELATNALKYGALSVPEGHVLVSWRLQADARRVLHLRWKEMGGPRVPGPPARRGFGSRVIEGTVRGQLGGAATFSWTASGLICDLEIPLRSDPASNADRGQYLAAAC